MTHIDVTLTFKAEEGTDPDEFGEAVLCAIQRSPEFATDVDGDLHLVTDSAVSR